ncbi:MAG: hypothetical protein AAFQ80_08540 [Cyanobacteria bacterium J06621_8]
MVIKYKLQAENPPALRLFSKNQIAFKNLIFTIKFFLIFAGISQAAIAEEGVIERLRRGEINELNYRVGLKTSPIYSIINSSEGFCKKFAMALEDKLNEKFPRDSDNLQPIKLNPIGYEELNDPRFKSVANKKIDDNDKNREIHFQCSIDTKRTKGNEILEVLDNDNNLLGEVVFSEIFLETGARLLVRKEKARELSLNDLTFGNIRIGLIKNTTTSKIFETTYRRANVVKKYDTRDKGIEDLMNFIDGGESTEIDAFAADDIIL